MTAQWETLNPETEHPAQCLPGHSFFCIRPGQEQGSSSPFGQPVVLLLTAFPLGTDDNIHPLAFPTWLSFAQPLRAQAQIPACLQRRQGGVWKRLFTIDSVVPTQSSRSSRLACLLVFRRRGWKRGKEEETEHEMNGLFAFRRSKSTLCGLFLRAQQAGNRIMDCLQSYLC